MNLQMSLGVTSITERSGQNGDFSPPMIRDIKMSKETKVRDEAAEKYTETVSFSVGDKRNAAADFVAGADWMHSHLLSQAGEFDRDAAELAWIAGCENKENDGFVNGAKWQHAQQAAREGALKLEIEHWSKKYGQYVDKWCDQEKELSALRNHHADLDMIIRAERNDNMALREEIERLKNGK